MEEFLNYLVIIINRIDECLLLVGSGGGGEGGRSLNVDTIFLMSECVSVHRDAECGWEQ